MFLRCGAEHHSVGLFPKELRRTLGLSERTTCMSFGVEVGSYAQLREAVAFLKAHGVTFIDSIPPELYPGIDYSAFALDPDGHCIQLYYYMEQIGWDGRVRPASERRRVNGEWPEALEPLSDTYVDQVFQGPWLSPSRPVSDPGRRLDGPGRRDGEGEGVSDPEAYLERVRALLPALRERTARAEQLRRLPDETFADFQEAGLFRALQPRRYGGYELDPGTFYQAVMEVGTVCGSSAWILGVIGVHNWHLAIFPPQAQEDVWGEDTSVQLSTSLAPTGTVERVEGGYRLMVVGRSPAAAISASGRCSAGLCRRQRRPAAGRARFSGAAQRLRDRRQLACHGALRHRQQGSRRR